MEGPTLVVALTCGYASAWAVASPRKMLSQALLLSSAIATVSDPRPVSHDACRQTSKPEGEVVRTIFESLLQQAHVDKEGRRHPMTIENILVVAPYNAQVNLLKAMLPAGARVGTIDKFQGQQADAVIVSMTSSNGSCLPRNIEFLYDKNRLNVAVSRARCLAIVVASPDLLDIRCSSPEQMELVNTLCWLREYADALDAD